MRTFYHSNQKSFIDTKNQFDQDKSFKLRIICDDGVLLCDRMLFILWSKKWMQILDSSEETSVLIFPDVNRKTMELLLTLLRKGDINGLERDFENFFELALEFLSDLPGGFDNFETSEKSFEFKAASLKSKRNKFKTLRKFTCEFCLSIFATKQSKDRHVEIHHQPKEVYSCSICHLQFRSKEGLGTHMETNHFNEDIHKCSICDAKFTNERNLKRHIKSTHSRYTCLTCHKIFEYFTDLDKHQIEAGHKKPKWEGKKLEKEDVFSCSNCDFKTARKDNLLRHRRLKHHIYRKEFTAIEETLKDNPNWSCSKCNKTFTSEKDIEDHLIDNCREIKCDLCDKEFTLKSNLKRHLEKKHPFVCTQCHKRFKSYKILRKHMKSCLNTG